MKFAFSVFITAVAAAAAAGMDFATFDASSKAAQNLLRSSLPMDSLGRELNQDNNNADENSFVADYSIYFDGCYNTTSWSSGGYAIVPLVAFRLCPTKYVHSGKCFSRKVGEYLTPMTTFVSAYMQYRLEYIREKCESMKESCYCNDGDDGCFASCYQSSSDVSWSQCSEEQDQGKDQRLGECTALDFKNNRRSLAQNENKYYMGPYCGPGGTGVFLTMFTDEYCTAPVANAALYYNFLSGDDLPYQYSDGATGIVEKGFISCADQDDNNGGNKNNEGSASALCQASYESAAKCEANMTNLAYPDSSACSYIALVKDQGVLAYQLKSGSTMTWSALLFVVGGVAALGAVASFIRANKRGDSSSRSAPLVTVVEMS